MTETSASRPGPTGHMGGTMSAARMLQILGPWSSHPRWGVSRLLTWYAIAGLPIVAAMALGLWWLSRDPATALTFAIDHGRTALVFGMPAVAFAMGLGLTAATATSAARSSAFVADSKGQRYAVIGVISMILLLGSLLWIVPLALRAPPNVRTFVALFGLIPLVFLFLLPGFLRATDGDRATVTAVRWRGVGMAAAIATVMLLSRVGALADAIAANPLVERIVCLVADAMPSSEAAAALPVAVRGWIITGIVGLAAVPVAAVVLVLADTLQDYMRRRRARREVSGHHERGDAPDWIGVVADRVDPGRRYGEWSPNATAPGVVAGPSSPSDDCNVFFGTVASVDQAAGFRDIIGRSGDVCANASHVPWWEQPSADAVVEGPRGSGRTALGIALIMHSVLVHGDTVLVLVPSAAKRVSLVKRIQRAAVRLGVGHLLHVEDLGVTHAGDWTDTWSPPSGGRAAAARSAGAVPEQARRRPNVLVGCPADFEQTFFAGVGNFVRLRALLCSIGLVVVEDIDLFEVEARIHLPFALAKIRLFLGTEGLGCQTVVVAPPLADAARELIERQLLSCGAGLRPAVRLRPMALPTGVTPAWVVSLAVSDVTGATAEELVEACATACAEVGVEAVVYSPTLAASELEALETSVAFGSSARVRAISDVDDWDAIEPVDHGRVAAALHAARRGAAVGLALVGARAGETPVVFAVQSPGGRWAESEPAHGLVVLPGRESPTLFAIHYGSIARFIERMRPAPRHLWESLGLPAAGDISRLPTSPSVAGTPLIDRTVSLDPSDREAAAMPREVWPWGVVAAWPDNGGLEARPVDMSRGVDVSMYLETNVDCTGVTIVQRKTESVRDGTVERRRVVWRSSDGGEVGRGDLAYTNSLRFDAPRGIFVPSRIEDTGQDAITINARPWSARDHSGQAYMPAYDLLELDFPDSVTVAPTLLTAQLPQRVAVYVLVEVEPDATYGGRRQCERQFASLALRGLYDESGVVRQCDATLRYEAAKFLVLFDPPEDGQKPDVIRDEYLVRWGAGREPHRELIPELGAAITFAMRRQAPGLERMVRCIGIGVRGSDTTTRRLGLLFLEPRSTESSGFALMEPIVCDRKVMSEFFGAAARILDESLNSGNPALTLYSQAESCIGARIEQRKLVMNVANAIQARDTLKSIADAAAGSG